MPKLFVIISGIVFMLAVLYSLLKKKSNISYSLIWLGLSLIVIFTGVFPQIYDLVSEWVGIDYQPMLAILTAILFLLFFVFYLSSELSVAKDKISELSMQISLLNNDIVELKEDIFGDK